MIISPLTFIRQTNTSLRIHNNMYNLGYKNITYCPAKYPKKKLTRIFTNDVTMDMTGLNEKIYDFSLSNNDGNSYNTQFFTNGESKTMVIKRLLSYIRNPIDEEIVQKNIEANRNKIYSFDSITESYAARYKSIKDPSETEEKAFYQILYASERMENIVMMKQNPVISDIVLEYGPIFKINVGANITSLDIFKVFDTNKFLKKIKVSPFEDVDLILPEDEMYYIDLCHDAEIIGRLVYYRFSDSIAKWIYDNQSEIDSSIDRTIINDAMLKYGNIDFSDDEKEQLIEEKNAYVKEWIVRPPVIIGHTANEEFILRLQIPDYKFLQHFDKKFYLSASDSDVFMEFSCYPWIEITKEIIEFNLNISGISNDIVFFIQDEDGTIISNYTRYNAGYEDYEQKKKDLQRLEYVDSLQKWLSLAITDKTLLEKINSEIKNMGQNSSLSFNDVLYNTLLKITQDNIYAKIRDNLVTATLNHWFDDFNIIKNFYPGQNTVTYYTSTQKMEFGPKTSKYVITVLSWDFGDDEIFTYHYSGSDKESVSINVSAADFIVIYMTDTETYKKSGYIYISNIIGDNCMTSNRFKIEVNSIDQ